MRGDQIDRSNVQKGAAALEYILHEIKWSTRARAKKLNCAKSHIFKTVLPTFCRGLL